jgi:hypothetical protein
MIVGVRASTRQNTTGKLRSYLKGSRIYESPLPRGVAATADGASIMPCLLGMLERYLRIVSLQGLRYTKWGTNPI